jgi:hydroxymethylbilane synthase
LRQDLVLVDIRGNIEERLALIDKGKIDALVVAHAALIRLGLEDMVSEVFKGDNFIVHPKQGSLTLVAREDKWKEARSILSAQAQAIGS